MSPGPSTQRGGREVVAQQLHSEACSAHSKMGGEMSVLSQAHIDFDPQPTFDYKYNSITALTLQNYWSYMGYGVISVDIAI
tara:strand:- start:543 stop:785 length:243 start_codon:yes stop_codon:yes gene_type:complete